MLAKYPQLHPVECYLFLHTPFVKRTHEIVAKKAQNQVVTASLIASMIDGVKKEGAASDGKKEKENSGGKDTDVLVQEYVTEYHINGYRVHDPRGKKANEFTLTLVHVFMKGDVEKMLVSPLMAALGIPVRVLSYGNALTQLLARSMDGATVWFVDMGEDAGEVTYIRDGVLEQSVAFPYGTARLRKEMQTTSEMTDADIDTSLPLLVSKTLEEAVATRLQQGVEAAAHLMYEDIRKLYPIVHHPVPIMVSTSLGNRSLWDALVQKIPYSTTVPHSELDALFAVART
jgi:hypothetical protein